MKDGHMFKAVALGLILLSCASVAKADVVQYFDYFKVDMADVPLTEDLLKSLDKLDPPQYDPGYKSRFNMENNFKKEFGRTIKLYGKSESRIKKYYEDDLLEVLSWMPESMYQYIGPMLHEIPGMPEKILNMPGIKETKNQLPIDIDDKFKDNENLEYLSPALYILLMPRDLRKKAVSNTDSPEVVPAKKERKIKNIPAAIKEMVGILPTAAKIESPTGNKPKKKSAMAADTRTLFPTAASPLTTKDAKAVMTSLDEIKSWGEGNNMENISKLMVANVILNLWENESGNNQVSGDLKDIVNPCQRLVLKMRFAGLYEDFSQVVAKYGFNPEEWAYTCDKTIKAFRAVNANHETAYAVRFHRRGYFRQYINRLPQKWREQMLATEAAIIAMYTVLREDAEAVRPIKNEFLQKVIENNGMLLTAPVFY